MADDRQPQLAYSEFQALMLQEEHRRSKARKILAVLRHFLGRDDLDGLRVADVGCSAGFIADELAGAGATTFGLDIDVPGLAKAEERFGERVTFVCASGDRMPLPDASLDVVVFNHIYEHVVDPDAVIADIRRVLKPAGVAYLGLGNKHQIVEPHYKLPFLSWLPQPLADRYVRRFHKADHYYESYRTRSGLQRMLAGFGSVWDYTVPVIRDRSRFHSADEVPASLAKLPAPTMRALLPIVPTFIWVASPGSTVPLGPALPEQPDRVYAR
jgi:SAM-dependent methyltransferase